MSLVEDLGAQVHGASEDLPLGPVTVAVQRLRVGMELLQWVRQSSMHEVGVGHLAEAAEQLEQAMLALRTAQDSLAEYLAAIGLGYDAAPTADRSWRESLAPPEPRPREDVEVDATPLGRWWTVRVDEVTGHRDSDPTVDERDAANDSTELLRRIAAPVRSGDRDRLREELRRVSAPVGLGLSAITPPVARHLATDLLRHEPTADDLPELTRHTSGRVRDLLPGVPDHVLPTLLARICRMPPPRPERPAPPRPEPDPSSRGPGSGPRPQPSGDRQREDAPTHPADPAVAGAVLVGVLLHRLGRDESGLTSESGSPGSGSRRGVRHG